MGADIKQSNLNFKTRKEERIEVFDVSDFPVQFREIDPIEVVEKFEQFLTNTIANSEDAATGSFGTIKLCDGREARVEVRIDADHIIKEIQSDNLELF